MTHTARRTKPHKGPGQAARMTLLDRLPVTERRHDAAGIPTTFLEGGDGPPLVLLHGPGEFSATWMRVIPDLAATHRLIVPDLPGHGASGMPADRLDADRVLAWLDELIAQTCEHPPALVGHLLGGAIAARYCLQPGSQANELVFVDTYGLSWLRPAPRFALAMIGYMVRPTKRTQERLFHACFADYDGMRDELGSDWHPLAEYALDRAHTREMKTALRILMPSLGMPPIPPDDLARLDVPTTLIWGRMDLQVRLSVAEEASRTYGWPLYVIEDAADDPAVEQPEAFLNALGRALVPVGG